MTCKRADKICTLAKKHEWTIDRESMKVRGASEAFTLALSRDLPNGRLFVFMIAFAKSSETKRWQALKTDGDCVQGCLMPGNGSPRDQLAKMYGSSLEQRFWRSVSSLEWWLARPQGVLEFEWVDGATVHGVNAI